MNEREKAAKWLDDMVRQATPPEAHGVPLVIANANMLATAARLLREPDADELLRRVHERINNGLDIVTFGYESGTVSAEVRWRRDYPEYGESDERSTAGHASLSAALRYVLRYEDEADARDAAEEAKGRSG